MHFTAERDAAKSKNICIIIGLLPQKFYKKLIIKLYTIYIIYDYIID